MKGEGGILAPIDEIFAVYTNGELRELSSKGKFKICERSQDVYFRLVIFASGNLPYMCAFLVILPLSLLTAKQKLFFFYSFFQWYTTFHFRSFLLPFDFRSSYPRPSPVLLWIKFLPEKSVSWGWDGWATAIVHECPRNFFAPSPHLTDEWNAWKILIFQSYFLHYFSSVVFQLTKFWIMRQILDHF